MKRFFISIVICCLSVSTHAQERITEDISNLYNAQCTDNDIFWGTEKYYSYLSLVFSSDRKQLMEVKIGNNDQFNPNTITWRFVSLDLFGELPKLVDQFENASRYRSPGPNSKGIKDFEADLEYSGAELSSFTSYNYGRSNDGGWHNKTERKIICKILSKNKI